MGIDEELVEEIRLKQLYSTMLHEDLVERLIRAHSLLNRTKFVLEQEKYLSLPAEINKFLKED